MSDICRLVRQAVQTRLSDATNGINATYSAIQASYATPDLIIDWSDQTNNFAWGRVPPDLIEESSPFRYPMLTIEASRGIQDPTQQRVRFRQFSGNILAVIEVHVSWSEEQTVDFETWPDAVIDAMFSSINDPTIPNTWGAGIVFNGDLNFSKSPIIMAGENWRRTITFPCTFKLIL